MAMTTQDAASAQVGVTQYGFYFDAARCVRCRTCEMACKSAHDLEPGVRWRWVADEWRGEYPLVTRTVFSLACMHCAAPACADACPTGAISKRSEDGVVVVDAALCDGCRECAPACPFGVPQFGADGLMQKCDYCLGLGREPACTRSCPTDALSFGPLAELRARAEGRRVKPHDEAVGPSIVIVL